MSREINKIHVNNSTRVSLNDRFTAFSARSATRPRPRRNQEVSPQVSAANRKLLQRLTAKHKTNINPTIKRTATIRRTKIKNTKRQMAINKQIFVKDLVKNSRSSRPGRRLKSTGNIASRLGVRQAPEARSSSQPRGRSRARLPNGRNSSRSRSNSNTRGRSTSISRGRANSAVGRNARGNGRRGRSQSISRTQNISNADIHRQNPRSRSTSRNRQLKNSPRKMSVGGRIGKKNMKGNQVINKGRIQRQKPVVRGQNVSRQVGSRVRARRLMNQVNQRSNSRGRVNKQRGVSQEGRQPKTQGAARRGRSRSRNKNVKQTNLNKEALDEELDQIMATSKLTY